jgi:Xaa-Pro dipeptidase
MDRHDGSQDPETRIRFFDEAEFAARLERARAELGRRQLDALLLFAPESLYYLTGYDSTGYVFFQCGVFSRDGASPTLLTRRPDVAQARDTSLVRDIRVWYDAEDARPAEALRDILADRGLRGARVGVELGTYGLTAANWQRLERALAGWCELVDAGDVVRGLRLYKSEAELAYVREAARLGDGAVSAMIAMARPGRLSGEVAAAGLGAILAAGGDMPCEWPIVNCGPRAVYGRSVVGAYRIGVQDQVVFEFASSYRRYTVCNERTVFVGGASSRQRAMFELVRDALRAMTEAARPGRTLGDIDGSTGGSSMREATARTATEPVATRSGRRTRRPGWTCPPCCTSTTRWRVPRAWCCSLT